MSENKFELIENEDESVDVQFKEINPNVDDQLDAAPSDDRGDDEKQVQLSAEEKVRQYLESDKELKEYGEDVQRRINKLTYNWRESERREQAALDYAQKVHQENLSLRDQQMQQDGVVLDEHKTRLEAQLETAKRQLKEAYETQDAGLIAEANQNIAQYAADLRSAEHTEHRFKRNQQKQQQQPQPYGQQQYPPPNYRPQHYPQQQQQMPQPDEKAEKWATRNKWFGEDRVMTNAAMTIHQELINEGYAPESDTYYTTLDNRLRENFPHKFQPVKPHVDSNVTPTSNSNPSRKSNKRNVKLTASQVNIAKRLGVPLEEYAKYV